MMTLTWNGADVPEELRSLPPGQYVIWGVDGVEPPLAPEQEQGVREAMAQARRGELLDHDGVHAVLKAHMVSRRRSGRKAL